MKKQIGRQSFLCFTIILLQNLVSLVQSQEISESWIEQKLLRYINEQMSPYNPEASPVKTASEALDVMLEASLIHIVELKEKEETLVANLELKLVWNDTRISWKPSAYENIRKISLPSTKIWVPHILLLNGADSESTVILPKPGLDAMISNKGQITLEVAMTTKTQCPINVRYYPYDSQRCHIEFGSPSNQGSRLNLLVDKVELNRTHHTTNWMWDLQRTSVKGYKAASGSAHCELTVDIRRGNSQYRSYVIFPSWGLMCLGLIVAGLGLDNGERVPLSVGIILSILMYQMYIMEKLPVSSDIPLLAEYCYVIMILFSVFTGLTIPLMWLYGRQKSDHKDDSKDDWDVPHLVKLVNTKLSLIILCQFCCSKRRPKEGPRPTMSNGTKNTDEETPCLPNKASTTTATKKSSTPEAPTEANSEESKPGLAEELKKFARIMDRTLFFLLVGINVIYTISVFTVLRRYH